jgi:cytochrome c biogenesis protein CcmG/thiol:disulfide interchange protein DsbE
MSRILLFIPLLLFIVVGVFLWRGLSLDPSALPSALVGKPLPAFNLEDLQHEGALLTSANLPSGPLLLNVWATWCPSCRQEHAQLAAIAAEGKIKIVGLNYKDDRFQAQQWLQSLGDPYFFNLFDPLGKLTMDLGVYGTPETYLIDAKRTIRYRQVGVMTPQVWAEMQTILAETGSTAETPQ